MSACACIAGGAGQRIPTDDLTPVGRMKLKLHQHVEVGGGSNQRVTPRSQPDEARSVSVSPFTTRGVVEVAPPQYEKGISGAARAAVDAFCRGS